MTYDYDCVIIGCGISGMTAAIYLKRANLNILVLDFDAPGGILNKINKIENYPGYIDISGPELAYKVYEQVKNLGIEIRYGKVLSISDHTIKTDIEEITTNKIIIATGRQAKKIKDVNDIINVSYCVMCDANLYKDKKVAIIGNNNSIDEVTYLTNICEKVIFLSTEEVNKEKFLNINNIDIIETCSIKKLEKENNKVVNISADKGNFDIDGVFISMGYEPNLKFLDSIDKENGYVIVNDKMQTNIDYIYACGDIIKKDIYQLTTAVSDATKAAIYVKKAL